MKPYRYSFFHYLSVSLLILLMIALWAKLIPLYVADVKELIQPF